MHLSDLQAFVAVAQAGSFAAAARAARCRKSTLSRRVARLEDRLGLALFTRAHPRIELTRDGAHLLQTTAGPLRDIALAEARLAGLAANPAGTLVVNAPHDIGTTARFARHLSRYCHTYPEVTVDVRLTDHPVDLVREGIDVALRPRGEPLDDRLLTRACWRIRGGLYASPALAATLPAHADPTALSGARAVAHRGLANPARWPLTGPTGDLEMSVKPALFANDFNAVAAAVVDGLGIGLLPEDLGAPHVAQGTLVRLLPEWSFTRGHVWIYWPESRHLSPRVRAFVDVFTDPQGQP